MRLRWRRLGFFVFGVMIVFVPVWAPGCSFSYEYELRGTVRNVADGTPVAGVSVRLQPAHNLIGGEGDPVRTNDKGQFAVTFSVRDIVFMSDGLPAWSLVLSKADFTDEVVDISPTEKPHRETKRQFIVVAYMKPAKH